MNFIHDESGNIRAYLQQAAEQEANNAEVNMRTAQHNEDVAIELKRPFMLLKPKIFPDGNQWCALYGENLQEGVAGFGDTPAKAAIQFDIEWINAKISINKSTEKPLLTMPDNETMDLIKQEEIEIMRRQENSIK